MVSTLRELFLRRTKVGDGTPPIVWKEEAVTRQASVVIGQSYIPSHSYIYFRVEGLPLPIALGQHCDLRVNPKRGYHCMWVGPECLVVRRTMDVA